MAGYNPAVRLFIQPTFVQRLVICWRVLTSDPRLTFTESALIVQDNTQFQAEQDIIKTLRDKL